MRLKLSKYLLLAILSAGVFLSVIDIFIVNVAIPSIKRGIKGSDGDIQLVIALYLLGYAAFLIAGGKAGDVYGRKKIYIASILSFTIASVFCGLAQTPIQMVLSRLAQGISAAFMVPQGISYIQVLFTGHKERSRAFGIYGSIAGTASVIGQLLGGILPDLTLINESWRLVFLINLPIGILFSVLAFTYLPDHKPGSSGSFDLGGAAILAAALSSLILSIICGRELQYPIWTVLLLAVSVVLLPIFYFNQKRKRQKKSQPLMNFELFSRKNFAVGICASLCYFLVQDTYFLINTILIQSGFGISSSQTGLFFVLQGLGYMLASLTCIRYLDRYGKFVPMAGILIMVVSLCCHIVFFNSPEPDRKIVFAMMFAYGIGCGTVLPSLLTLTLKDVPTQLAGAASGTYSTFQQTAVALGIGILGGIFYNLLGKGSAINDFLSAYSISSSVNVGLLVLVGLLVGFIGDNPTKNFDPRKVA